MRKGKEKRVDDRERGKGPAAHTKSFSQLSIVIVIRLVSELSSLSLDDSFHKYSVCVCVSFYCLYKVGSIHGHWRRSRGRMVHVLR